MKRFQLYKRLKNGGHMHITSWECETIEEAKRHFKDNKEDLGEFNKRYYVTEEILNETDILF